MAFEAPRTPPERREGIGPLRRLLIPAVVIALVAGAAGGLSLVLMRSDDCTTAKSATSPAQDLPVGAWETVTQQGGGPTGAGEVNSTPPSGSTLREIWCVDGLGGTTLATSDGIIFAAGEGADGLVAIDARTGDRLWARELGYTPAGPVIASGRVIVATSTGLLGLDPADGTEVWSMPTPSSAEHVVALDDRIVATYPDYDTGGDMATSVSATTGERGWETVIGGYVNALAASESAVAVLSDDGRLALMEPDDGNIRWSATVTEPGYQLALSGETVAATTLAGELVVHDVRGGDLLWAWQARGGDPTASISSMVASRGYIYVFASEMVLLDASDGSELGSGLLSDHPHIAQGEMLTCKERIPLGEVDGQGVAFEVSDGDGLFCPSVKLIANGAMYVGDGDDLRAFA